MAVNQINVVCYEITGNFWWMYSEVDLYTRSRVAALYISSHLFHKKKKYRFLRPYIADYLHKVSIKCYKAKTTFYDKFYVYHNSFNEELNLKKENIHAYKRTTFSNYPYYQGTYDITITCWLHQPNENLSEFHLVTDQNPYWSPLFLRLDGIIDKQKKFNISWMDHCQLYNACDDIKSGELISQIFYSKAMWEYSMGIHRACIEDCRKALDLNENCLESRILLAKCFFDMQDYNKCADHCDIILNIKNLKTDICEEINILKRKAEDLKKNLALEHK